MKETITINLAGIAFTIDVDAYKKLELYLDRISKKFELKTEKDEILQDIELRASELFQSFLGKTRQVVEMKDVEELIRIMGSPEDYDLGEEEDKKAFVKPTSKRFYRNPENSVFGGVASGLSVYLDVDAIVFRVLFIVLCLPYGMGAFLYLVLWALVPSARSAAQRIEMSGERFTIENIEKNLKEEVEVLKEKYKRAGKVSSSRNVNHSDQLSNGLLSLIIGFGKFIGGIFALVLIVVGFSGLLATLSLFFLRFGLIIFNIPNVEFIQLEFFELVFGSSTNVLWFSIAFLVVLGIPFLSFIYAGFSILFNFRSHAKGLSALLAFVWLFAFFTLIFTGAFGLKEFKEDHQIERRVELPESDTLYLYQRIDKDLQIKAEKQRVMEIGDYALYWDEELNRTYGKVFINVFSTREKKPFFIIRNYSRGPSRLAARERAKELNVGFELGADELILDRFFELEDDLIWSGQQVKVNVYLPEGTIVFFDEDIDDCIDYISFHRKYHSSYPGNQYWEMSGRGLKKIDD